MSELHIIWWLLTINAVLLVLCIMLTICVYLLGRALDRIDP